MALEGVSTELEVENKRALDKEMVPESVTLSLADSQAGLRVIHRQKAAL